MILSIRGLTKQFDELTALSNVDLEIQAGEIFGIVGPNGAGKSTLFNLISGYYPPTAGQIIFKGNSIEKLSSHQVCKRGIARTFQVATAFQTMTVFENIRIGSLFGTGKKQKSEIQAKVLQLIDLLDLMDKKDILAENLDLYTTKLVMFGAALATNCDLILLDEPMAGLSITEIDRFGKLLKKINKENSITVMIIEHLIDTLVNISNRIMVLHLGQVIYTGLSHDMVKDERVIEVYLGE
jgi:branched-chain amino acid transport system ATP-binding protein